MAIYVPVPEIFASPSFRGLEPGSEMRLVPAQAEHVRSLLDELDRIAPSDRPPALSAEETTQTVQHLGHLARRIMAALASIAPDRAAELKLATPEGDQL